MAVLGYILVITKFFGIGNFASGETTNLLLSYLEFWTPLIGIFIFAKKIEKREFLLIKEQKKKWWFYPIAFTALIAVVTISLNIITIIESSFGIHNNSKIEQQLYEILCTNKSLLIPTCITAAVTEELLFRGYLLSRIKTLTNSNISAVLVSAFLFGIAHFGYGDLNRVFFPFIIGIFLEAFT